MTIGANTYAEHADVERLIGDIVEGRIFNPDTVPSLAQVETELDAVAADINSALDTMGYIVPVDAILYPSARAFMKAANAYGAAGRLLGTIPTEAYNPDEQMTDTGQTRGQMYERYLNQALKRIWDRKLRAGMRESRFHNFRVGASTDSEGAVKEPLYRRRMEEYPGARILPSPEDESEEDDE